MNRHIVTRSQDTSLSPPSRFPETPIHRALWGAITQETDIAASHLALLRDNKGGFSEPEVHERANAVVSAMQKASELLDWVCPPRKPLPSRSTFDLVASLCADRCWPDSEFEDAVKLAQTRSRWRPPKNREMYIQALELTDTSAKHLTWGEVALKLCKCGKTHDLNCGNTIRLGVKALKEVLQRHGVEVERKEVET
jgi:hypothetical protein